MISGLAVFPGRSLPYPESTAGNVMKARNFQPYSFISHSPMLRQLLNSFVSRSDQKRSEMINIYRSIIKWVTEIVTDELKGLHHENEATSFVPAELVGEKQINRPSI